MPTLEHLAGFSPLVFALFGFAPQDTRPAGRQSDGSVIVPTHQTLRPAGDQVEFPGRPTDLLLLDRGRTLAVKNRTDLVLIEVETRTIRQALAVPKGGLSYHGIAASSSGDRIFVTGSDDQLWIAKREKGVATWEEPVHLPGPGGRGASAPGGIALRGEELFVTLSRNNALGIVSLADRKLTAQIPVGVAPYAVLVEGDRAYVTNWGGRHPREGEPTDTSAGTKVLVDEQTNVAASGTMSVVDLKEGEATLEIELGLHPCGMALDRERSLLYVANANSDTVSVVDLRTLKVARTLPVRPRKELPFGSAPNALALTADGKRLFVANGTNNAIAVLDPTGDRAPLGFLPVGWYPGGVLLDPTGRRLFVANTKGLGSLQRTTGAIGFNARNHLGSVSILTDLSEKALAEGTRVTEETNRFTSLRLFLEPADPAARPAPIPARHGEPSVFEHVLYVIKENRTYDQVLGDQPRGNGDASLCVFGRQVTPNHHALTDEFVLLDNFNCGGVLSADGHQWTNEAYVTDYLEKSFGGFARSYPYEGDDPLVGSPGTELEFAL